MNLAVANLLYTACNNKTEYCQFSSNVLTAVFTKNVKMVLVGFVWKKILPLNQYMRAMCHAGLFDLHCFITLYSQAESDCILPNYWLQWLWFLFSSLKIGQPNEMICFVQTISLISKWLFVKMDKMSEAYIAWCHLSKKLTILSNYAMLTLSLALPSRVLVMRKAILLAQGRSLLSEYIL